MIRYRVLGQGLGLPYRVVALCTGDLGFRSPPPHPPHAKTCARTHKCAQARARGNVHKTTHARARTDMHKHIHGRALAHRTHGHTKMEGGQSI